MDGSVMVVGGSKGLGRAISQHYVDRGREVILTSRDAGRAESVAKELGDSARGIAVDLNQPQAIASALSGVGPVQYLVIAAVERDENTIKDYNVEGASNLATLKLVGYPAVVNALLGRLTEDAAVVLFGGLAKDRPYPGSTMVSTVNGAMTTLINTLALELAPIRFNTIHPAVVGDTPYWEAKPAEVLEGIRSRTPTGRLVETEDIIHAVSFLLENRSMNGVNLVVDGGSLLM